MNFSSLRTLGAIALTALLTACGAGQPEVQAPMQLASVVQRELALPAGPDNPAPDCAADGCAGLRIIDGNAEAFRVDAMRRAAGADQS